MLNIYENKEKNLNDYFAVIRTMKRSIKLFILISILFLGFGIYFMIAQGKYLYYGIGFIAAGILLLLYAIFRRYYLITYPKKNPLYDLVFEDVIKNNLKNQLVKCGLKSNKIDYTISPYRYIRIGYLINDYCYKEARIEVTRHGYGNLITNKVRKEFKKSEIINNLKKTNFNKFVYQDNKITKDLLYQEIANELRNEININDINSIIKNMIDSRGN